MTTKETAMGLFRPSAPAGKFKSHFRAILASLKFLKEAPIGYEDDSGFNYGDEPKRPRAEPPAD